MSRTASYPRLVTCAFFFTVLTALIGQSALAAGQLTLTWTDNSNNEDGFRIERKTGALGTYAQVALINANASTYVDTNLPDATNFCYRVGAYNTAGSAFSSDKCATTASAPPVVSYLLTISKAGTGSGIVTANGISCGSDCSQSYTPDSSITLTATAASGSTFAGWSGTGCGNTLSITGNMTCTATFNLNSFTLSVSKAGTGSGTITANGINCGSDCNQSYTPGSSITLTATATSGSTFAGWTGAGCSSGAVTMNGSTTCAATFTIQPVQTYTL
ncbi:MAG: InlB B-repeat-containing protein, partial [Candidatus Binatia bacterium]